MSSLVLAALLSLFSIYRRFQVESLNRALALATEIDTVETLGALSKLPVHTTAVCRGPEPAAHASRWPASCWPAASAA